MDKSRYIERIKKLLALATSSNAHEAANAMNKAQSLMRKYQIDHQDIELSEIESADASMEPTNPPLWTILLITMIHDAFGVKSVLGESIKPSGRVCGQVTFWGPAAKAQVAKYCFDVLYRQLLADRKRFIAGLHKNCKPLTKRRRADWYCQGWISQVNAKVDVLVIDDDEQELVERAIANKHGTLGTYSAPKAKIVSGALDSYNQGAVDGDGVTLNPGVSGRERERLR
jgi:hypothetical protein